MKPRWRCMENARGIDIIDINEAFDVRCLPYVSSPNNQLIKNKGIEDNYVLLTSVSNTPEFDRLKQFKDGLAVYKGEEIISEWVSDMADLTSYENGRVVSAKKNAGAIKYCLVDK